MNCKEFLLEADRTGMWLVVIDSNHRNEERGFSRVYNRERHQRRLTAATFLDSLLQYIRGEGCAFARYNETLW